MKKILAFTAAMVFLLSGCGSDSHISDGKPLNDSTASTQASSIESTPSSQDGVTSKPTSYETETLEEVKTNAYASVDRTVLATPDELELDVKRLPNIESITAEQIAKCMITPEMPVTTVTDSAYKAKGADAALKFIFSTNMGGGQALFAEKLKEPLSNGLDEAVVLDPVDESLSDYEGIRYYAKIKRPEGKKYSQLTIRFIFGTYSYYRLMYQYTTTLPEGDFEGYIYVPFDEMVSGYNTEKKACNPNNISFFGFNIALEGNAEGLEVYLSDFGAYREKFW
ncbi:MAG: hypothetical protein IKD04_06575 [Clostridia bacterium]|nr:hypothetical protein [Clostridia bacterium]